MTNGQTIRMKSHFQHFSLVWYFLVLKKTTSNLSDNVILIEHFKWVNICIVFQGCSVHAKQRGGQKRRFAAISTPLWF